MRAESRGARCGQGPGSRGQPRGVHARSPDPASLTCHSAGVRSPRADAWSSRAEEPPAHVPREAMSRTCDGRAVGVMARFVC